jgi:hypothetical protein
MVSASSRHYKWRFEATIGTDATKFAANHLSRPQNRRTAPLFSALGSCWQPSSSAANPVLLPKAKPRAMGEHFVVSPIRSGEVARTQRSVVRLTKEALKSLDFVNSLLGVHPVNIKHGRGNRQTERHLHFAPARTTCAKLTILDGGFETRVGFCLRGLRGATRRSQCQNTILSPNGNDAPSPTSAWTQPLAQWRLSSNTRKRRS